MCRTSPLFFFIEKRTKQKKLQCGTDKHISCIFMKTSCVTSLLGGGRVTRFPFGHLNCFRIHFTLGRPGKFSKQAAFWRRLSELMVNARTSWCNSTGSKSKQHDNVLIQNWNMIQLNLISFLHLVAPAERFLYGCSWDPMPWCKLIVFPWTFSSFVV